jgi:tRNA (guanine37-N1)-methyltransferase
MFAAYPADSLDKLDRAALDEAGFQIPPPGVAK